MSAGFHYSPRANCPACQATIHPGLLGDLVAHAEASGRRVLFGCASCGADLRIDPRTKELEPPAPPAKDPTSSSP